MNPKVPTKLNENDPKHILKLLSKRLDRAAAVMFDNRKVGADMWREAFEEAEAELNKAIANCELEAELRGRIIEACRQHDVKYAADGCQFCDGDAYSAEHDVDISHIQDMESKLKAQKEQENK